MFEHVPNKKEIARRIEDCRLAGGEVLDLSNLYMTELPAGIEGFENLTELNVSCNCLKTLPDFMSHLRLESLRLKNIELAEIPEWLGSMTDLKELDLSENKEITFLPQSFNRLCNLEVLDISGTSLTKVPDCIREFKNLKKLSLGGSFISPKALAIPDWIGELINPLEKLEFCNERDQKQKVPLVLPETASLQLLADSGKLRLVKNIYDES